MAKKGGQPTKLTQAVQETILEALRSGHYQKVAAAMAGVSEEALMEWVRRGEGRSDRSSAPLYVQFAKEYRRAIAESEQQLLKKIVIDPDWRSAAWLLERRFSERWANTQRVQIEVEKELDKVLDKLENALPPEIFDRVLSVITDGEIGQSEEGGEGEGD